MDKDKGKGEWLSSEDEVPFGSVDTGQSLVLERGQRPPKTPEGHVWALRGYMAMDGSSDHTHACYVLYRKTPKKG